MIWVVSVLGFIVFIMSIVLYRLYQRVIQLENAVAYLAEQIEGEEGASDFLTEFGIGFVRGFFGV